MGKGLTAAIAAALLMAGCAIHPVPEDVTGVTTYEIARQVRCETREAAKNKVLGYVQELAEGSPYQKGDPLAQKLWERYGDGQEDISTFSPALFAGADYVQVRAYLTTIYSTAVAYAFDLEGDETNNLGTVLDWLGPWFTKLTLNYTGDLNRERSNEESFTLTDTLGGLLTNLSAPQHGVPYCGPQQLVGPNYIYPVAGKIGVDKTVDSFFNLTIFTGLTATGSGSAKAGNAALNAPTYTEKLIFTTTIDSSVKPTLTFTPIKRYFQFADASVTGLAKRVDTHKVYISLAVQPTGAAALASLQSYLFPAPAIVPLAKGSALKTNTAFAATGVAIGNSVIAEPRTPGEVLALTAVDQVRSREIDLVRTR